MYNNPTNDMERKVISVIKYISNKNKKRDSSIPVDIKPFKKSFEKTKGFKLILPNYKDFVSKIKNTDYKFLYSTLPKILLAITFIVLKNKSIIKLLLETSNIVSKSVVTRTAFGKFVFIIKTYIELLNKLTVLERLEQVITLFVIFVEDIPSMVVNISKFDNSEKKAVIYKDLIKNVNFIHKDVQHTQMMLNKPEPEKNFIAREISEIKKYINQINQKITKK